MLNTDKATVDNEPAASKGWPIKFSNFQHPPESLAATAIVVFAVGCLGLSALAFTAIWRLTIDLIGDDQSRASEAVRSILPLVAAAVGLPLIVWRLAILNRQTKTAEAKTQIDRETHYTSIFSRSVDQLGQTRETTEQIVSNGMTVPLARTVPNIEVRLGGIHSLTRLAEESARDVTKIERMLTSYVRENSWSDRNGRETVHPLYSRVSTSGWEHEYYDDDVSQKAKQAFAEWTKVISASTAEQKKWAETTSETRVDVNEAIEAVGELANPPDVSHAFYECLFVGRAFRKKLLENSRFDRCTFVRCNFEVESTSELAFQECLALDCAYRIKSSKLDIRSSVLINTTFFLSNADVSFRSSDLRSTSFSEIKLTVLRFNFTTSYRGWYGTHVPLDVQGRYSVFVDVNFDGNVFEESASFYNCALIGPTFKGANLALANFYDSSLNHAVASPTTQHPKDMKRPKSWPLYDKNDTGDEIPF